MKNQIKLICLLCATIGHTAWAQSNVNVVNPPSRPVPVTGTFTASSSPVGAANYANGQVVASTTAGTLITTRATRRSVSIVNTDATITVYIGKATVTAGNGMPLKAGQSISIDTNQLIQVISASGTPTVAYMETYD